MRRRRVLAQTGFVPFGIVKACKFSPYTDIRQRVDEDKSYPLELFECLRRTQSRVDVELVESIVSTVEVL